jgi:glycosidase
MQSTRYARPGRRSRILRRIASVAFLFLIMQTRTQPQDLRLTLDGNWAFRVDSARVGVNEQWFAETFDRSDWAEVAVPGFWESYPGCAQYDGWGWFARRFTLKPGTGPASIHFAGVDDEAVVWINGIPVGEHSGYTDPFALDATGALRPGENSVVVLVKDNAGGGGIYRSITLIDSARLPELLRGPLAGTTPVRSAAWVRQAVIYSVYLRSFSPGGTFAGLERRLPELKALGVTVLWLLPIHPVGVTKRKGTLGSPYAVRDYYAVNPEFGTMEDFKRLLAAAHRLGLKLIIDLVANHTSWDSRLMQEHPEWFTRGGDGRVVPPNPDWSDVADLDYTKPGLRQYMSDMMVWWVRDVGIDGFRCDVAELVPTDFWEEVRSRLDRVKPVMMLSEGSLPEHHRKAFDITYSWNVYDALEPVLTGKRPVRIIDQILQTEELQFPRGALRLRFTTNHDKNAWDAPALRKFGLEGLRLATVLVNTLPGVPLIYTGEEIPNDRTLSLFEKVDVDWSQPQRMAELTRTLFRLRRDHPALSRGQMLRFPGSAPDTVYAFIRAAGKDRILVVLNFSASARRIALEVPVDRVLPGARRVVLRDLLEGGEEKIEASALANKEIDLPPWGYRILELD